MKKLTLLFTCLVTMFCSIAQVIPSDNPGSVLTQEDYLKKSKSNKTGALVCLIGGGSLFLIGSIVAAGDFNNDVENLFTNNTSSNHDALIGVLVITGGVAMLSSIPLFRAASKNKRKAYSLSAKNEMAPLLQRSLVFYKPIPSLTFKIRL